MDVIWTKGGPYRRVAYSDEADLEAAIVLVQREFFGANRIYLDIKKKIGTKGNVRNIPDGYLIDLNGPIPRLYVVENELASHDLLRHIAVQILEFSLSFEDEKLGVKRILFDAIAALPDIKSRCEAYAATHGLRNLDFMLERLVYDTPFTALVIIDEIPDTLESVLLRRFQFGVEVLELARYENSQGEHFYRFEPFLADVSADIETARASSGPIPAPLSTEQIDTVVVPAWDAGFQGVFMGENRWHAIRMHGTMRSQIKYIAVYRVAPISAITNLAPVSSIEPWQDTDKFVVNFAEPAQAIGPIPLVKGGRVKALQSLRYTNHERLLNAKTLDDLW